MICPEEDKGIWFKVETTQEIARKSDTNVGYVGFSEMGKSEATAKLATAYIAAWSDKQPLAHIRTELIAEILLSRIYHCGRDRPARLPAQSERYRTFATYFDEGVEGLFKRTLNALNRRPSLAHETPQQKRLMSLNRALFGNAPVAQFGEEQEGIENLLPLDASSAELLTQIQTDEEFQGKFWYYQRLIQKEKEKPSQAPQISKTSLFQSQERPAAPTDPTLQNEELWNQGLINDLIKLGLHTRLTSNR